MPNAFSASASWTRTRSRHGSVSSRGIPAGDRTNSNASFPPLRGSSLPPRPRRSSTRLSTRSGTTCRHPPSLAPAITDSPTAFTRENTMSRAATEYRYEKLTWPEINDAVDMGKVCIVPCGSVEQHGPHLPLDVDIVCPQGIAYGAGKAVPDKMLVLPPVWYGYTAHVMDFPGTINND